MKFAHLSAVLLAGALAACSNHPPGGPGGPGRRGPSPNQSETTAAIECRLKPFADANGSVSREALDKGLRARFAAADTDRNGVLEKKEVAALNAARAGCDTEPVIDWSNNGQMTYAIFAARDYTLFDRADEDGDGVATAEEMSIAGHPPRGREKRPEGGAQGPGGPQQ